MKRETWEPELLPRPCGHEGPKFGCLECVDYNARLTLHRTNRNLIETYIALDLLDRGDLGG